MPSIYEVDDLRGEKTGTLRDHDELEYQATKDRAKTQDPRQRFVPSLCIDATDALIDLASARHR